jgi:hypothetical protein
MIGASPIYLSALQLNILTLESSLGEDWTKKNSFDGMSSITQWR